MNQYQKEYVDNVAYVFVGNHTSYVDKVCNKLNHLGLHYDVVYCNDLYSDPAIYFRGDYINGARIEPFLEYSERFLST